MQNKGTVIFAGAGAGGLDNLTIGVLGAIKESNAILYDALIDNEIIEIFPQKCLKICVGKRAGNHSVPQEKTNELLIKLAKRGLKVLRLKGGDPSIFGRITEERLALDNHNISHKTLAGLSAVQIAAAQFDFSLTSRKTARSIELITASNFLNKCEISSNILNENKTIAFYMGGQKTSQILQTCKNAKINLNIPIAIIENAGRQNAKIVYGKIFEIESLIKKFDNNGPILIIMGKVLETKINTDLQEVLQLQSL